MTCRAFIWLACALSLVGCGITSDSSSPLTYNTYYSVTGPTKIARNTCTAFTVTRFTRDGQGATTQEKLPIQPAIVTGKGGVYADAACTKVAMVNVFMEPGSNTTDFYFTGPLAGMVVLEAGDILLPKESRGKISITVE